eukprot:scaffold61195_cov49-Phaeocystis_antarctica.AAC.1
MIGHTRHLTCHLRERKHPKTSVVEQALARARRPLFINPVIPLYSRAPARQLGSTERARSSALAFMRAKG